MKLSGFGIVRNAERLIDFPIEASLRSILPICDEVVVNVGAPRTARSNGCARSARSEAPHPGDRVGLGQGEALLAPRRLRAMGACRHPGASASRPTRCCTRPARRPLRSAIEAADRDPRVEGVVVRYRHLFGDPSTEAVNRRWYRREVRAVRLDPAAAVHPYRDAQGFPGGRSRPEGPGPALPMRSCSTTAGSGPLRRSAPGASGPQGCTPGRRIPAAGDGAVLPLVSPACVRFAESHPRAAREWVAAHAKDPERVGDAAASSSSSTSVLRLRPRRAG